MEDLSLYIKLKNNNQYDTCIISKYELTEVFANNMIDAIKDRINGAYYKIMEKERLISCLSIDIKELEKIYPNNKQLVLDYWVSNYCIVSTLKGEYSDEFKHLLNG